MIAVAHWPRVSDCLDEALELAPAERAAWLAALRAREPEVAAGVAALLDQQGAIEREGFLEGSAPQPVAAVPLLGRRVGAYTLQAPIGHGGMGSVWRAVRSDGEYDAAVAIKLLNLALIGAAGVARFKREGSILARLQHPHIAHLLDAGTTEEGQPYLVLELVEGEAIDVYCGRCRLGVAARIRLFLDVVAAVAHAHTHLVVHRDLKPSNVLVSAGGEVKLLDFGIARLLEVDDADAAGREATRALTPQYAAPEQLQGGPITTATDVYSLGVMLYQLLSGRHPAGAGSTTAAELIRATLDAEPARVSDPTAASPRSSAAAIERIAAERSTSASALRRQLEGDLDNIVARALRKRPEERYPSAAALADDLRRHLAHEPVSARADSVGYRLARFVRRNRAGVAAAGLVAIAVAAGVAGTVSQARRAEAQAVVAGIERDNARRELAHAESSAEFIGFLLSEGGDKPFTTTELLARGAQLVERQFGADPAQRARLQLMLAELYGQAQQQKRALALVEGARAALRGVDDPALHAYVDCQLALHHVDNGSLDVARPLLDGAIAVLQRAAADEHTRATLAGCLGARANHANVGGDIRAALADAQAAVQVLGDPRPDQRMLGITMRTTLADLQGKSGQLAAGVAGYEQAIAEIDAMGRGRTRVAATLHNNLGAMLSKAGQTLRAAAAYERGLDVARGFSDGNPVLEANYAKVLIELGRADESLPLFARALARAEALGNRRAPANVALVAAPAWCAVRDLVRCGELVTAARALTTVLPAGHSRLGTLEMAQAQLALARGEPAPARAALGRAVAIFDAASDKNNIGIRALTLLARTEQQLGALDDAGVHAARAVAQARAAMGGFGHSEWLGSALVAQGLVERARGDATAAQAAWRAAVAELEPTVGEAAPATAEARRLLSER
ncbi:MAG: protein kinase domain-containing protein [Caldimonas sp.]